MDETAALRADRSPALPRGSFLPDLCKPATVLGMVIVAALVALVLALASGDGVSTLAFWVHLAASAWLLLWIGLGSAALLCLLRRSRIAMHGPVAESVAALLVLGGVTALASFGADALGWRGVGLPGLPGEWFDADATAAGMALGPFILRNLLLAWLLGGLGLRYAYVAHQWRLQVEAEGRARVVALQARIRPHFLFNSLNTVAALAPTDGERAAAAVEDLADLFRATLAASPQGVTLGDELATAEAYLRLEQARLASRLEVRWQLPDLPTATPMPALMLQPLLENAVFHGIERLPAGGCITVRGGREDGQAWLSVENPLPVADTVPARTAMGHQEALANIRERLALLFGDQGRLTISTGGGQFTARLQWPVAADKP